MTSRRAFLVASSCSLAGLRFGSPNKSVAANPLQSVTEGGKAKSVILFFLCGGASHVDTWDMKPDAPAEYRGPFQPIATSAGGVRLCEHLPMLAKQAHHLAVVNSVCGTVNTNDHHAGYYYNLTGHVPDATFLSLANDRRPYADDWPYMGAVVGARRSPHEHLPNAITIPHKPSKAPYTRPGQFAARLGVEFDPLYVSGNADEPLKFQAPSLVLAGDVTADQLQSRQQLLTKLDRARTAFDHSQKEKTWKHHQGRTFDLLMSTKATQAFDVGSESLEMRERYGKGINAMSLLLARLEPDACSWSVCPRVHCLLLLSLLLARLESDACSRSVLSRVQCFLVLSLSLARLNLTLHPLRVRSLPASEDFCLQANNLPTSLSPTQF